LNERVHFIVVVIVIIVVIINIIIIIYFTFFSSFSPAALNSESTNLEDRNITNGQKW